MEMESIAEDECLKGSSRGKRSCGNLCPTSPTKQVEQHDESNPEFVAKRVKVEESESPSRCPGWMKEENSDDGEEFLGGFLEDSLGSPAKRNPIISQYTAERFRQICGQRDIGEKILGELAEKQKDLHMTDSAEDERAEEYREISRRVREGCRHFLDFFLPGENMAPISLLPPKMVLLLGNGLSVTEIQLPGPDPQALDDCYFKEHFDRAETLSEKLRLCLICPCRHFPLKEYLAFRNKIFSPQHMGLLSGDVKDFVSMVCRLLKLQPILMALKSWPDEERSDFVVEVGRRMAAGMTCEESGDSASLPDWDAFSRLVQDFSSFQWEGLFLYCPTQDSVTFALMLIKVSLDNGMNSKPPLREDVFSVLGERIVSKIPDSQWEKFRISFAREVAAFPRDERNFPGIFHRLSGMPCDDDNSRKEELLCTSFSFLVQRFLGVGQAVPEDGRNLEGVLLILEDSVGRMETSGFDKEYQTYLMIQCLMMAFPPFSIWKAEYHSVMRLLAYFKVLTAHFGLGDRGRLNHIIIRINMDIVRETVIWFKPDKPSPEESQSPQKPAQEWPNPVLVRELGVRERGSDEGTGEESVREEDTFQLRLPSEDEDEENIDIPEL